MSEQSASKAPRTDALAKHERHLTVAETRYWLDQYKTLARQLETELSAKDERIAVLERSLLDPEIVHTMMLKGTMAKISMMQCAHTHGEAAVVAYRQLTEQVNAAPQEPDEPTIEMIEAAERVVIDDGYTCNRQGFAAIYEAMRKARPVNGAGKPEATFTGAAPEPHDFPGDFWQENGCYRNLCGTCYHEFRGRKGRVTCAICERWEPSKERGE